MEILEYILLIGLILCSAAANMTRKLLHTVIIYSAFSTILCVIWLILRAPDLAITEAAVGTGISTILFLLTLRSLNRLKAREEDDEC